MAVHETMPRAVRRLSPIAVTALVILGWTLSLAGPVGAAGAQGLAVAPAFQAGDLSAVGDSGGFEAIGAGMRQECATSLSDDPCSLSVTVAKYLPNGRLHRSFGEDGIVRTDVGPGRGSVTALRVGAGRAITVASSTIRQDSVLIRYLKDGALDPSLGTAGIVRLPGVRIEDMQLAADGRLVAAGTDSTGRDAAIRLLAGGAYDPSFGGGDGLVRPGIQASTLALQTDGRIVLGGPGAVARLQADGSPDTSFSGDGVAEVPVLPGDPAGPASVTGVDVQPDGAILASYALPGDYLGGPRRRLTRLTLGGVLDPSFGEGGTIASICNGRVRTQDDGSIVLAGGSCIRHVSSNGAPIRSVTGRSVSSVAGEAFEVLPDGRVLGGGSKEMFDKPSPFLTSVDIGDGLPQPMSTIPERTCRGRVPTNGGIGDNRFDDVIVSPFNTQDGRPENLFISSGRGDDLICLGPGIDAVDAGPGTDVVRTYGGDDKLSGGSGDDRLYGGAGQDRLRGEEGGDILRGGPNGDRLFGGPSRDFLDGGPQRDELVGGPGPDVTINR